MATNAPSLDDLYDAVGHKYDIDPLRLKAHAIQETGERADVASSDGKSWGFGQFKPGTWKQVMPGVPLSARGDPATAIEAMGRFIAANDDAHRDANGNTDLLASTAAYNGSGPAADTYARKIQAIHGRLVAAGGLKTSGTGGGKAGAAANDDAFGQTLKGEPAATAPTGAQTGAADDPFAATLKGGPAKPTEAPASAASNAVLGHLPGASSVSSDAPMPTMPSGLPGVPDGSDTLNGLPPGGNTGPGSPVLNALKGMPTTAEGYRNLLADKPGWTASSVLPMRVKNDAQGNPDPKLGVEWDLGPMRGVGRGVVDLLDAPYTTDPAHPQLSPEATNVLFGAMTGGGLAPSVARGTGAAIADTAAYGAPLNALYGKNRPVAAPGNALAGEVPTIEGTATEVPPGPSPGIGAPQPPSAGAAGTPSGQAEMSMAEFKANRKQGELNAIMEPNAPGPDTKTYVEGSVPTRAEHSNEPAISQHETLLRERDPDAYTKPGSGRLWLNNEARVRQFEDDMGSAPAREAINQDLRELAQREQPLVLRNARPIDLTNVKEVADGIVNNAREAERDAVQKVIKPLRDALTDANGKLKSDPLSGWGMIDNIRDKIDRSGLNTSQEQYVVSHLLALKQALTKAMDQSTDGRFSDYLGKQASLLQQRNAMDVLQKFRPQLTNAKGDIQFAAFHRWMLGLARQRGAPGADPAMAIPDSTMQKLIGIDKDLKRAQNIDLGKSRGSQTNLLFSLSKSMGLGLVHAGVHGGVAAMGGGGVGNLMAQQALSGAGARINALNLKRHVRRSLAPPPAGENWLAGP